MGRRILSIWLPHLPLERRARLGDPRVDTVFAITAEIKNAMRLTHLSQAAIKAGISPGLSVPDARALCPDLLTEKADPVREALLLRALHRWADQLSPWIALDRPDGLVLDISGCAHLFGGEPAMARHTEERFADMRFATKIGIADTKGAARAMARYSGQSLFISHPGQTRQDLARLPIEAFDVPAKVQTDIRRIGFKTIGDLYPVKHSELARRFGVETVTALSKMLGQFPDPVSPKAADPVYAARMNLPEPIGFKSDLQSVLSKLTTSVCDRLEKDKRGARQFHLTVRCVDTGDHVLTTRFAKPCFDGDKVIRQFERPLDSLKIQFGADWFRLVAETIEPIRERQRIIGGDTQEAIDELSQVITTLGNRLGFDRVRKFVPCESHHPGREFATIEAADSQPITSWPEPKRQRPLRVFKPEYLRIVEPGRPPKQFEWRKTYYTTATATGPERLSPEWWQDNQAALKDYWVVKTDNGPRLWLLTYPGLQEPRWYVAGQFL